MSLTREEINRIVELIKPYVPQEELADIKIRLEKMSEDFEEEPDVFTVDAFIKDLSKLVGEIVYKKSAEALGKEGAKVASRLARASIYLFVGPKIREIFYGSMVVRKGGAT